MDCSEASNYQYQRIHYVSFPDFGKNGIPHVHIEIFGYSPKDLPEEETISEYMEHKRSHCSRISKNGIVSDGEEWTYTPDAERAGNKVFSYAAKKLCLMMAIVHDDLDIFQHQLYSNEDHQPWTIALFWALESRFVTASNDLNSTSDLTESEAKKANTIADKENKQETVENPATSEQECKSRDIEGRLRPRTPTSRMRRKIKHR